MRTVYYLMTHTGPAQVARLVARLRTGGDRLVLVHHDAKSREPPGVEEGDDVRLVPDPVSVRWADMSVVLAMLRGLDWLRERREPFDWVIFLSGQDYPIRPLRAIEAELARTEHDAFFHWVEVPPDRTLHTSPYQTVAMRRYFRRRIRLPGGYLFLRRRHPYRDGLRCYAGSQWLNLSRAAVESAWRREGLRRRLLAYLESAICPDETFFQTWLLGEAGLRAANDDRRFILWTEKGHHPLTLCTEHLPAILASDAWFARKVDERLCPQLLERLDERILA